MPTVYNYLDACALARQHPTRSLVATADGGLRLKTAGDSLRSLGNFFVGLYKVRLMSRHSAVADVLDRLRQSAGSAAGEAAQSDLFSKYFAARSTLKDRRASQPAVSASEPLTRLAAGLSPGLDANTARLAMTVELLAEKVVDPVASDRIDSAIALGRSSEGGASNMRGLVDGFAHDAAHYRTPASGVGALRLLQLQVNDLSKLQESMRQLQAGVPDHPLVLALPRLAPLFDLAQRFSNVNLGGIDGFQPGHTSAVDPLFHERMNAMDRGQLLDVMQQGALFMRRLNAAVQSALQPALAPASTMDELQGQLEALARPATPPVAS